MMWVPELKSLLLEEFLDFSKKNNDRFSKKCSLFTEISAGLQPNSTLSP